jgi:hypothetical protein
MENEKQCFKCGEVRSLSDFYKHSMMADGHVNKCKQCNKKDVTKNRESKIDYYRAYDRDRGCRKPYSKTKAYRDRYPKKFKAHNMVDYHLKTGNLVKQSCEICGEQSSVHAHHDDYDKPLNVRWLCAAHHCQWHKVNGEGANPF